MKVICAWCKKVIGNKKGTYKVSHGMCPECAKKWEAEIKSLSVKS